MNDQASQDTATFIKREIFLSIKYYEDCRNREFIEEFLEGLAKEGISGFCVARDLEHWGDRQFPPETLMSNTFTALSKCDVVVVDFAEKGFGVGIEAGYAAALGLPVLVIAPTGTSISTTLSGIAKTVIFYNDVKDAFRQAADYIKKVPTILQ